MNEDQKLGCVKRVTRAGLWALPLVLAACGSTDDRTAPASPDGGAPSNDPYSDPWVDVDEHDSGTASPPGSSTGPFVEEFTAVHPQTVAWSDYDVTLKGARVRRGLDEEILGLGVNLSDLDIFVELDLDLKNVGTRENEYVRRDTWDLILADGTRLRSEPFSVRIAPGDTAAIHLYYDVGELVSLDGATLELNGSERGSLEPAHIPLDAAAARSYPLRLEDLVGVIVEPDRELFKVQRHEIRRAALTLDTTFDGGHRAEAGKVLVELDTVFTAVKGEAVVSANEDYRIVVDGHSQAPINGFGDLVASGTSIEVPLLFSIDQDSTAIDIEFKVGFDSDASTHPRVRVHADLSNVTLVPARWEQ